MKFIERINWIRSYWKNEKKFILLLVLLTFISTSISISYPMLFKYLIDFFYEKAGSGSTDFTLVNKITGIILIVGLFQLISNLYPATRAMLNNKFEVNIRQNYFEKILNKSSRFFEKMKTGDVAIRLTDDIADYPRIGWFLCSGIFRALESSSKFIFCIIVMLHLNFKLALISMLPLPLMVTFFYFVKSKIGTAFDKYRQEVSDTGNILECSLSGIRIIKAHRGEKNFTNKFKSQLEKRVGVGTKLIKLEISVSLIYQSISFTSQFIIIMLGGYKVIKNEISMGDFYAFYTYLGMLLAPMLDVPNLFVSAKESFVSMNRLQELQTLDLENEIPDDFSQKHTIPEFNSLEFRNVSFSYDGIRMILENINFSINKGEVAILFGAVGSGKSTLIKLALGLLTPSSGTILINDISLNEIDLNRYWSLIGFVPQDPILFSDTIIENVKIGRDLTNDEVNRALQFSNILDEVNAFDKKLDTKLTLKGASVSGGQKQRLSIARALVKNPQLVILDDSTSALDADNEKKMWEAFQKFFDKHTSLVITHRVATAKYASSIYILSKSHLMKLNPNDFKNYSQKNLVFNENFHI